MDSEVRYLYERKLELTTRDGRVEFDPVALPEWECVQYRLRMPSDSSSSVHYEVCTIRESQGIRGYSVVLHAEGDTADRDNNARRALVRYLRDNLRKREIWNSRFEMGQSWVNLDVHCKDCIPVDLSETEFVSRVTDLLSELYNLVEDLLVAAERDPKYNPYGYDEAEEGEIAKAAEIILEDIETGESKDDKDLWPCEGDMRSCAAVVSVARLLKMKLRLPDYQRPYKWGRRNVGELLKDIGDAIELARTGVGAEHYRLGTVIVHEDGDVYKVVDGQQRLLTLSLLLMNLRSVDASIDIPFVNDRVTLEHLSRQPESLSHLHENYLMINEYFGVCVDLKRKFFEAMAKILQVVIVRVRKEDEAFQLFDSQNARGRALDPHDLLKAYHLRAMEMDGASDRQMRRRVVGWESVSPDAIRSLFDSYLFRIYNWSRCQKTHAFTAQDIAAFKGLTHDRSGRLFPFVRRAVAAGHEFQVGEDFAAGEGFFALVEHYLDLRDDVNALLAGEMRSKGEDLKGTLRKVSRVMVCPGVSGGYRYLHDLFKCALFCYADRFGVENVDARVLSKLCRWAYAVMLDLNRMSEKTVNRYAIGQGEYENCIPMFAMIRNALQPIEIIGLSVKHKKVVGPLCRRLERLEVRT